MGPAYRQAAAKLNISVAKAVSELINVSLLIKISLLNCF
jgi:hypothetical protein